MKHERFLANTCRVICALSAFVLIGGTSAVFAQNAVDKSPTKGSAMPAVTQSSSMDKKGSMMPGMTAGGDMHGSMTGMIKNMESMKMSGDTDRDFATMMKAHHQGAIDMAQMELQSGKDAKMRAMAKRIIKAQQKEIKEFDQWLGKPR